jgi:hypothetical protein
MVRSTNGGVDTRQLLIGMYDVFTSTVQGQETNQGVALVVVDENSGLFTEHFGLKSGYAGPRVGEALVVRMAREFISEEDVAAGWRDFFAFLEDNSDSKWIVTPCIERPNRVNP